ncbi:hypothetical protein BST61_g3719 [Cercospora zeina]
MGARLSQPRGPGGMTEASVPVKPGAPPTPGIPFPRRINSRTIVAPAAAFTMACLLFVYAKTSIRAAKANAQRHRDADTGGEGLSLLAEHRRRHGKAESVEGTGGGVVAELGREVLGGSKKSMPSTDKPSGGSATSEEEEKLKSLMRKGKKGDNS